MPTYKDRFSFNADKCALRVRSTSFGHVLKELLSNSLDSGAPNICLCCHQAEGKRKNRQGHSFYEVECTDDGSGCDEPQLLRSVGSTTSDDSPTKRGRFGQGLIDVLAISEDAEIRTHKHHIIFSGSTCKISTVQTSSPGLLFKAEVRHPGASIEELAEYFQSTIVPSGVHFTFNGKVVNFRKVFRSLPGIKLPAPIFNPETESIVNRTLTTELHLLERFGQRPMIYEMGIPVDEMPWSLPYDVDVLQKTPLDPTRVTLKDNYKNRILSELIGPCSDLYAEHAKQHGEIPAEIRDIPENAMSLDAGARVAIIETNLNVSPDKIVLRGPKDDLSEVQELEHIGFSPINRGHLPKAYQPFLKGPLL